MARRNKDYDVTGEPSAAKQEQMDDMFRLIFEDMVDVSNDLEAIDLTHGFLNGDIHTDVVDQSASAGSIVIANATPEFTQLAIGAEGNVLFVSSSLPAWTTTLNVKTGQLGVGTGLTSSDVPSGPTLHVRKGNAGTDPSWLTGDVALLENTAGSDTLLNFFGTAAVGLSFSDTTRNVGGFTYDHATDSMVFRVNGATRFTITSGGLLNPAANAVIGLPDINLTHFLRLDCSSDLTADRILSLDTGDAARTVTLTGNPTLADWFDQSVKTTASPTHVNVLHTGYAQFAGISVPSTPSAGFTRLFAKTVQGHTHLHFIDEDGTDFGINHELMVLVKNTSGSQIDKGKFVDINGSSGQVPTIQLADADAYDSGRPRHAEGVALENIANNGFGIILTAGMISNIDTSGVSAEGVAVYLSTTAGGFTETVPTGGTVFVQHLGVVTNKHATQGSIELSISAPERIINPVEQTTTSTGTQNDFSLSGKFTHLRCNNASDVTFTGFTVGGSAPVAGDMVWLTSMGAGHVYLDHQDTGSTAAYRLLNQVTSGVTPLAAGKGTALYIYDDTTDRWRLLQHTQGAWIAVAFASGNFTATESMTWTVAEADQVAFNYMIVDGQVLFIQFTLNATTVGGTPSYGLHVTLPNGYTIGTSFGNITGPAYRAYDSGTDGIGFILMNAATTYLELRRNGFGNWAASTDNTTVQGQVHVVID